MSIHGRRYSHYAKTQSEIRQWLRLVHNQLDAGIAYDAAKTTLEVFLVNWIEQKKTRLRIATAQQYDWAANSYIVPAIGKLKLSDVTPGSVQRLYDDLLAHQVGKRTIQVIHAVIHGCLEHAIKLGLLGRNASDACIVPKPEKKEMAVWTESQVSAFLLYIRHHKNEILYHLALATGMRRGELLGLKWTDVDWVGKTLRVQRQAFEPNGGGVIFQEPKSDRGKRSIELGDGMMQRIREQMKLVDQARRFAGGRWREHELIFPSTIGTPQRGENISHEFAGLVQKSGLPRIRLHDCRHTAASIMLSHGIPPIIVSGILGHSLAVLMDKYAHFIPSSQGAAARLMDLLTTPIDVTESIKNRG